MTQCWMHILFQNGKRIGIIILLYMFVDACWIHVNTLVSCLAKITVFGRSLTTTEGNPIWRLRGTKSRVLGAKQPKNQCCY